MDLRKAITRNITYSKVSVSFEGENQEYTVYGETTAPKEMKKVLKDYKGKDIPQITVDVITEKRAITIDDFIKYSQIIEENSNNESEENNHG